MLKTIKIAVVSTVALVTLSACSGSSYDTTHYYTPNISHCLRVVNYGTYWECHHYTSGYNYRTSPNYKPVTQSKNVTKSNQSKTANSKSKTSNKTTTSKFFKSR